MNEDERVNKINLEAGKHVQDWLEKLEDSESADDLLASLYGGMVAAYLLGSSPDVMVIDAKAGAERLLAMVEDDEND